MARLSDESFKLTLSRLQRGISPSVCQQLLGLKTFDMFVECMHARGYTEYGRPLDEDYIPVNKEVMHTKFTPEMDNIALELLKKGNYVDVVLEMLGYPLTSENRKHLVKLNKKLSDSYEQTLKVSSAFMPVPKKVII